ncbi:hypothetical protein [Klebsiella quasipneumoniae]|nr:hypothetical protein [Klebsiella quasipneumoniae subsp. similipneumoniae]
MAAINSTRVDSNWISHIVGMDGRLRDGWYENTISYGGGNMFPGSGSIWERIVEGYWTVWSPDIMREAFLEIESVWTNSLKLLNHSCLCAAYSSLDGMIFFHFWYRIIKDIKVNYISRMVQANDNGVIEAIVENAKKMPSISIGLNDKKVNDENSSAPDLSFLNVCLSTNDNYAFADFVKLVNHAQ